MAAADASMAVGHAPHILVVAGSDSSGGAGLVRDIETLASCGIKTSVAVTAITVQTHAAVLKIAPAPAAMVAQQMRAALSANRVDAVKIGMLANAATIRAVEAVLANHPRLPVVLDPILVSSSGRTLLDPAGIDALFALFPLCTVVTPNMHELARLASGSVAPDETEAIAQARRLITGGRPGIVIKGGHAQDADAIDILLEADAPPLRLSGARANADMRGTGCIFASAIAAGLAQGRSLAHSVKEAKAFVAERFENALRADDGRGLVSRQGSYPKA